MYYNPTNYLGMPGTRMQTYQQPMMPAMGLKGRQVSSIDEVRAAQIDFDGLINYFPCPAQNAVYAKYIDLNTGSAVVLEYRLQPAQPAQQYADAGIVQQLAQRIERLEQQLGGMTHDAVNANVANDAGQS